MKKILPALLLLLLAPSAQALRDINYPFFRDVKELRYETRLKGSGKLLFREEVKVSEMIYDSKDFLVTHAVTRGKDVERKTVSYYTIKDGLLTAYSHAVETSKEARPYQLVEIYYDWNRNEASFKLKDWEKKKNVSHSVKLTDQTIFARDTTILIPSLICQKVKEAKISLLIPTGNLFKVRAIFSYAPEELVINGKKASCYRVELKPDFILISWIAPRITLWYLASPPYNFVRYEGPLGGPFSPTVIQEITNI
jgi:hypothetical protein